MTELMQMIETLIDQFLLLVPSPVFVELPLLGILLANPNGRYVVAGLAVVTGFIGLWIVLRIVQILLGKHQKTIQFSARRADFNYWRGPRSLIS